MRLGKENMADRVFVLGDLVTRILVFEIGVLRPKLSVNSTVSKYNEERSLQ